MAHLEFLNGSQAGERIPLHLDHSCSLGRDGAADVTIKAAAVEDVHCVIKALKDGGYGLKDLDSATGTFVNDKKITAVRLHHHDRIRVGTIELRFAEREEAAATKPAPAPGPGMAAATAAARPALPRESAAPLPAHQPRHEQPAPDQPTLQQPTAQPSRAEQRPPPPQSQPPFQQPGRPATEVRADKSDVPAGSEIGGYRIEEKLGQGGMGTVYRATQLSLGRQIALKVLSTKLTKDPAFVARFLEEARAAGRFNHPNVVQVYDVGNAGDLFFYSMELVEHGSIEERVRRDGALPHPDATRVIRDAAKGLAYAESLKIVHRDIKPDNLMTNRLGITKIADLGLATDLEQGKGTQGSVFGTPHFIAPEQALGKSVDGRSDLYSLGCTYYRVLTGKTPFSGDTVKEILRQQIKEEPKPIRGFVPAVPEKVVAVVTRLMKKDPEERFASANELLEQLEELLGGGRRRGSLIAAVVVAVLAIGTAIFFFNKKPELITKIVKETDPNAGKTARQLREMEAENRHIKVDSSLADADRVVALTRVAEEYKDTEYARKVHTEIEQLRAKIAREEKERQARTAAVAAVRNGVGEAAEEPLARSDFAGAEKALAQVPTLDQYRAEPTVAQALTAARERIAGAARTHFAGLLDGVPALLADKKTQEADDLLARVATALADPALSPELRSALAALEARTGELATATRTRAAELAAATAAAALASYRSGLFGNSGVLDALAEIRMPDALARVRATAQQVAGTPYAAPSARLAALIERAAAFHAKFIATTAESFTSDSLALPDSAEAVLLSSDAAKGIRLTTDRKARNRKEEWWPWSKFTEPGSLSALFSGDRISLSDQDRLDRAAFLGVVGLAQPLVAAREYLAKPHGTAPQGPAPRISTAALQAALAAAQKETAPAARELETWLREQLAALDLLSAGLAAFGKERFTEANLWLTRLADRHPGSLAFAAVSRPGTSCLPK